MRVYRGGSTKQDPPYDSGCSGASLQRRSGPALWTRRNLRRGFAAPQFVRQDDRLGDFLLRLPSLTALPLNREVRLFLGEPHVALQDALRAVEHLSCLEPLGELRVLDLEARGFDLGADEEADRRD